MYRMFGNPYKAFTFYYGPIMFYLPVGIAWIAHCSLPNAYYASLAVEWPLGTWALWKTVTLASRGTRRGREIFLLCWLFFISSLTGNGANYTPLRFTITLVFAMSVENLYRRGSSMLITFGLASLGIFASLFFSPEQGISFFIGTLLFFSVCVRDRRPGTLLGLAGFTFAFAVAAVAAWRMGNFSSIAAISGGSLDFPLAVSYLTIVPLLLIIIGGCVIVAGFRNRTTNHPVLYLICVSVVTVPAALSRADPGHIIINTLGVFIAALVVLSQYPAVWRWTRGAVAVLVLLFIVGMWGYVRYLRSQLLVAAFSTRYHSPLAERLLSDGLHLVEGARADARMDQLRSSHTEQPNPNGRTLPPRIGLMAPMAVPLRMVSYPGDPQIIQGRTVYPLTSLSVVQEKIAELAVHKNWPLLVPYAKFANCDVDPSALRSNLEAVLGAPYIPLPRHQLVGMVPLCNYINANYTPSAFVSPVPGFYVWVPRGEKIGQSDKP
jgi:hypothetical protein